MYKCTMNMRGPARTSSGSAVPTEVTSIRYNVCNANPVVGRPLDQVRTGVSSDSVHMISSFLFMPEKKVKKETKKKPVSCTGEDVERTLACGTSLPACPYI